MTVSTTHGVGASAVLAPVQPREKGRDHVRPSDNPRQHEGAESSPLVDYFRERDGDDPAGALDLLAPEVGYHLMPKPGVEISGTGRERLRTTLSGMTGRPGLHHLVAEGAVGGVQFVVGHRIEDGEPVGTFLAAATATASGEITQYVGAFFDSMNLGEPQVADGEPLIGGGAQEAGRR